MTKNIKVIAFMFILCACFVAPLEISSHDQYQIMAARQRTRSTIIPSIEEQEAECAQIMRRCELSHQAYQDQSSYISACASDDLSINPLFVWAEQSLQKGIIPLLWREVPYCCIKFLSLQNSIVSRLAQKFSNRVCGFQNNVNITEFNDKLMGLYREKWSKRTFVPKTEAQGLICTMKKIFIESAFDSTSILNLQDTLYSIKLILAYWALTELEEELKQRPSEEVYELPKTPEATSSSDNSIYDEASTRSAPPAQSLSPLQPRQLEFDSPSSLIKKAQSALADRLLPRTDSGRFAGDRPVASPAQKLSGPVQLRSPSTSSPARKAQRLSTTPKPQSVPGTPESRRAFSQQITPTVPERARKLDQIQGHQPHPSPQTNNGVVPCAQGIWESNGRTQNNFVVHYVESSGHARSTQHTTPQQKQRIPRGEDNPLNSQSSSSKDIFLNRPNSPISDVSPIPGISSSSNASDATTSPVMTLVRHPQNHSIASPGEPEQGSDKHHSFNMSVLELSPSYGQLVEERIIPDETQLFELTPSNPVEHQSGTQTPSQSPGLSPQPGPVNGQTSELPINRSLHEELDRAKQELEQPQGKVVSFACDSELCDAISPAPSDPHSSPEPQSPSASSTATESEESEEPQATYPTDSATTELHFQTTAENESDIDADNHADNPTSPTESEVSNYEDMRSNSSQPDADADYSLPDPFSEESASDARDWGIPSLGAPLGAVITVCDILGTASTAPFASELISLLNPLNLIPGERLQKIFPFIGGDKKIDEAFFIWLLKEIEATRARSKRNS